jgi:predicted metal-dependent hydrolase
MLDWTRGELAEGLRCYRAEEFFAAHEHWEGAWLEIDPPEKAFLQGLIQMAAAFHHLQRRNLRGTASLLGKALRRIEPHGDCFAGLELALMREEIRAWLAVLHGNGTPAELAFPQIRLRI